MIGNLTVLTFSGTGNSRYIAKQIAEKASCELIDLNRKIKETDNAALNCGENLVFSLPTYAWRIPRIVEQWIENTTFIGAQRAWFVMSCGGSIGNTLGYLEKLCRKKSLHCMGVAPIVMPENYVAMFPVPNDTQAKKIIAAARPRIDAATEAILAGQSFSLPRKSLTDRILSALINPVFYHFGVQAKPFRAENNCTGCGLCSRLCPLNNISIKESRPVWGNNCTHCMSCICRCPEEAIEYGNKSAGKPRYHMDEP